MDPVAEELASWREEAAVLRRHGHDRDADRLERLAERIEDAFRAWSHEELTIAEATAESRYSAERLRELVREGTIPDRRPEGSHGEIHIRRCDLPRKPGPPRPKETAVDRLHARLAPSRR